MLLRVTQLMEDVWLACQLDRWWAYPLNLGWINLFARWATSPPFRFWWPVLAPMFSPGFRQFIQQRFPLRESINDVMGAIADPHKGWIEEIAQPRHSGLAALWWEQRSAQPARWDVMVAAPFGRRFYQNLLTLRRAGDSVRIQVGLATVTTHEQSVGWTSDDFFVPPSLWGAGIGSHFLNNLLLELSGDAAWCYVIVKAPPKGQAHRVARDDRQAFVEQYKKIGFRDARPDSKSGVPALCQVLGYEAAKDTLFVLDLEAVGEKVVARASGHGGLDSGPAGLSFDSTSDTQQWSAIVVPLSLTDARDRRMMLVGASESEAVVKRRRPDPDEETESTTESASAEPLTGPPAPAPEQANATAAADSAGELLLHAELGSADDIVPELGLAKDDAGSGCLEEPLAALASALQDDRGGEPHAWSSTRKHSDAWQSAVAAIPLPTWQIRSGLIVAASVLITVGTARLLLPPVTEGPRGPGDEVTRPAQQIDSRPAPVEPKGAKDGDGGAATSAPGSTSPRRAAITTQSPRPERRPIEARSTPRPAASNPGQRLVPAEGPRERSVVAAVAPPPVAREDVPNDTVGAPSATTTIEGARADSSSTPFEAANAARGPTPLPAPPAEASRADVVPRGAVSRTDQGSAGERSRGEPRDRRSAETPADRLRAARREARQGSVADRQRARAGPRLRGPALAERHLRSLPDECLGVAADVECRGVTNYVPRVGSQYQRTESRQWTFRVRKGDDNG